MQIDFHYYATYCAAILAGYSHEESLEICYSAQFVDLCSRTLLLKIKAPQNAATTQLQLELMDARTDIPGLQDITRIWSSFHFLPYDLYAGKKRRSRRFLQKYRLICAHDGKLVADTVNLAGKSSLQHVGIAMHVLADTWAHGYFAGTPSLVINNTQNDFYEILPDGSEEQIQFRHNPSAPDEPDKRLYTNSLYQGSENSVMNLGHGRAGHLPDYSFIKYRYMPAWDDYRIMVKDNPSDYRHAFCQMIYAMKTLRAGMEAFETNRYDFDAIIPYEERIREILTKRQILSCAEWKEFGEDLSGEAIPDFDIERYQNEYTEAPADEKGMTFLGRFIEGALMQKNMVTAKILQSGNILAGIRTGIGAKKLAKDLLFQKGQK